MVGTFHQWYEVYREEGYEPDQAESMAERSARSEQLLPDWYLNPPTPERKLSEAELEEVGFPF